MSKWLLLIGLGSAGTVCRYLLSLAVANLIGTRFPLGTLIVNLIGCLLMGFLIAIDEVKFQIPPEVKLFLLIGFLGAFTTFSSFIAETADLIKQGAIILAFCNLLCSLGIGFLAFVFGVWLGKSL